MSLLLSRDTPEFPGVKPAIGAEELCHTYSERVFRFAAMVARGNPEAEDIAQEALLKAIRKLDGYDPRRGSLDSWLWTIVLSVAHDAGRAAGRRLALWQRLIQFREQGESVESMALDRLSDARLLEAVRSLPRRDRTLIALRFGAGLDYESTGAAVGLSAPAATMALRRALNKLRVRLEATDEANA